jgi:hypothetical protein
MAGAEDETWFAGDTHSGSMDRARYAEQKSSLDEVLPVRQWGNDQPAVVALVLVTIDEHGQDLHEDTGDSRLGFRFLTFQISIKDLRQPVIDLLRFWSLQLTCRRLKQTASPALCER